MGAPKFSLRALLVLVAVVAIGCFALITANELWLTLVFSLVVGLLLFALVAAVAFDGNNRAFWLSFALVGWAFFWIAEFSPHASPLVTTKLTILLHDLVRSTENAPAQEPTIAIAQPYATPVQPYNPPQIAGQPGTLFVAPTPITVKPDFNKFLPIANCLWTVLLAFGGGLLGRYLYARRRAAS